MKYNMENTILKDILDMIENNVKIYLTFSDEMFIKLNEYITNNDDKKDKHIPYKELVILTKEVILDLMECPYLYDFREL